MRLRFVGLWAALCIFGFVWGLSYGYAPLVSSAVDRAAGEAETPSTIRADGACGKGETLPVVLVVEGREYRENACIPAHFRLLAARYGGYDAYFSRMLSAGATVRQILNAAAYPLGDGLVAFLLAWETPPASARVTLTPAGPQVEPHRDGYVFAPAEVLSAVAACLDGRRSEPLRLHYAKAAVTTAEMRRRTSLLATFSTPYAYVPNRVHNLWLAAGAINAYTLYPNAEFSFNAVVGDRTEARGYRSAKIIADGAFVEGVGGGVCQVSTTLYNAAMLAGLTQVEVHRHSLAVSYVAPSRDAMVSTWSDMRFANPYDYPVYLYSGVAKGRVTVRVYGPETGRKIRLESTCKVVDAHRDLDEAGNPLSSTEGYRQTVAGVDGVEGTLVRFWGDEAQFLRRNTYPKKDAVWQKIPDEEGQDRGERPSA